MRAEGSIVEVLGRIQLWHGVFETLGRERTASEATKRRV